MESAELNATHFMSIYDGKKLWVCCQICMVIMTIIALYVFLCSLKYVVWITKQMSRKRSTSLRQGGTPERKHRATGMTEFTASGQKGKYKRLMNYMLVVASFSTLLKFLVDQIKFFYAWNARSDYACEVIYDITDIFLYACAFVGVYGFLWLKQWIFYSDPVAMNLLYHRFIVVFSRVFVLIITIISGIAFIANIIPSRYKADSSVAVSGDWEALAADHSFFGCISTYDMDKPEDSWPLILYVTYTAVFHSILLALFLYPIVQSKVDQWRISSARDSKSQRKLFHCIKARKKEGEALSCKDETTQSKDNVTSSSNRNLAEKENRFSETCYSSAERIYHNSNELAKIETIQITGKQTGGKEHSRLKPKFQDYGKIVIKPIKVDGVDEKPNNSNMLRSIRRAIIWTTICVVTDTTLVSIFARIGVGLPLILTAVVTDFDLLLNVVCIVATYSRWRQILSPFCIGYEQYDKRRRVSSIAEV